MSDDKERSILQQTMHQIVTSHRPGSVFTELTVDPVRYEAICDELFATRKESDGPILFRDIYGETFFVTGAKLYPSGVLLGGVAVRPRIARL